MDKEGCAYGKVSRTRLENVEKIIKEMRDDIKSLANHYSKRLPTWASILFMLLTAILGGLITRAVF